jgi:hypothetical protein
MAHLEIGVWMVDLSQIAYISTGFDPIAARTSNALRHEPRIDSA